MLVLAQACEQGSCTSGALGLHQHAGKIEPQTRVVGMMNEPRLVHSLRFFDFATPVKGLRQQPNGLTIVRVLLQVLSQYHGGASKLPRVAQPGRFRHRMRIPDLLSGNSFDG
jgi:hypothetical protein